MLSVCGGQSVAQRTTRGRLRPTPVKTGQANVEHYDTIVASIDSTAFVISGYEKALRSTKESFFITNRSTCVADRLVLRIEYNDMQGRMLDQRVETIDIDIPPDETRKVDLPSWDKQKVFYYHLSSPPRGTSQATPYKVAISVVAAMKRRR